jgi:hypothetical protein
MSGDRSLEDLAVAAGHLDYQFCQLVIDVRRIHEQDNAFLEAYPVHARALIEFLIDRGSGRNQNDIVPDDFVDGWAPPDSQAAARMLGRLKYMDQHLSHLSWERVEWQRNEAKRKAWDYGELTADIVSTFCAFVRIAEEQNAEGASVLVTRLQMLGLW